MANVSGRFNSPDKGSFGLFIPQTLNRYVYTASDPINNLDRDGNEIQCPYSGGNIWTCIPEPVLPFVAVGGFGYPPCGFGDLYSNLNNSAYFDAMAETVAAAAAAQNNPRQLRWERARALGIPVGRIGLNGGFNDEQMDKIIDSLIAVLRGRFVTYEDCRTLLVSKVSKPP